MNHRNAGLALELLSPLFFLQSPPIFAPHLRLEPILQFTALHLGNLHQKMGQVGIKGQNDHRIDEGMNRNESQEAGVALELLSPLFFLGSPCFCSPLKAGAHPAIYCSSFKKSASKNGAGWHQGSKNDHRIE